MNIVICSIAHGAWYPRGISRMIQKFEEVSPGYQIQAHINCWPFGAPGSVVENGYEYGAYCAKPFALLAAMTSGADVAILLDAAFYPIAPIRPLVDHIAQQGYFFCKNGNSVGEWSSDRCLERMGVTRKDAFTMEEISSYCVGLNFADGRCVELLQRWCGFAADRLTIPGPHTSIEEFARSHGGRNVGHVSDNTCVKGHRHDQSALSILAHRIGMQELTCRPKFTAYLGSQGPETVLINHGGFA